MRHPTPPLTLFTVGVATLLAAGLGACSNEPTGPSRAIAARTPSFATGLPGNPSTALYKFNIIGVSSPKDVSLTNDQGKRMFVLLNGHSTINLQKGDFDIIDANATDKDGGLFQLPDPDPDNDGVVSYQVWVRTVGTPGGHANIKTCFTSDGTGAVEAGTFCSLETTVDLKRDAGKPAVYNVTKELLTACINTDLDPQCDQRVFLFDDGTSGWLWDYNNQGLKIAQVYFFPISQNIGLTP